MIIYSALYDENILHFIGQWHMAIEGARMRDDLMAFRRLQEEEKDPGDILTLSFNPDQYHRIEGFLPGVQYHPKQWDPIGEAPFDLPILQQWRSDGAEAHLLHVTRPHIEWPAHHDYAMAMPPLVPAMMAPGQVIFIVNQAVFLQDNDILNLFGGPEPQLDPTIAHRLHHLAERADAIDVLGALGMPHSPADLGTIVTTAHEIVSTLAEDASHVVDPGGPLAGHYVNGETVDEPLLLDDLLPPPFLPEEEPEVEETSHVVAVIDEVGIEGALVLQAGANMAMNAAVISNVGLLGGVVGVAGDVHRLDAIIQSNAYSDADRVGAHITPTGDNTTAAYNFARFSEVPMSYAAPATGAQAGGMPGNWIVSVVEGDLIFSQWVVQTNFVYDNDINVLCETGAYSNFVTGANLAHNIVDFSDLGLVYDLILIGGNLYDANIISQINVLLDDDRIFDGVGEHCETDPATSDNLLYNGATIINMGAQDWLAGLPQHYLEALERLADGNRTMPEGFGDDQAFAGFDALSVLVVTGNVYDLHYVKQTNIVGDADLVAAAQTAALEEGAPDGGSWDISTGQNALINTATIFDADSLGDVAYAGGDIYSDAILIQAQILAGPEDEDPEALVSEVIAFITADDGADVIFSEDGITSTPGDSHTADVMGSVLT